mgnify:CR=1 FL=1
MSPPVVAPQRQPTLLFDRHRPSVGRFLCLHRAHASGHGERHRLRLNGQAVLAQAVHRVSDGLAHLFLHGVLQNSEIAAIPAPQVDESLCNGCGECGKFCAFHAIVSYGAETYHYTNGTTGASLVDRAAGGLSIKTPPAAWV